MPDEPLRHYSGDGKIIAQNPNNALPGFFFGLGPDQRVDLIDVGMTAQRTDDFPLGRDIEPAAQQT
jgi:hypothetical protein